MVDHDADAATAVIDDGPGSSNGFAATRLGGRASSRVDLMRDWCRRRPAMCIAVGFAILVGGGLLFLNATGQRSIGLAVLQAGAAALVGAIGLLLLNEPIVRYVRPNPRRGLVVGILGFVAGLFVVWLAIAIESPLLAIIGVVAVLLALLALNAWLLRRSEVRHSLLLGLGQLLLIGAPLLMWLGDGVDRWAILAVVPWVVGLVLFKIGLPRWIDEQRVERRRMATIDSLLAIALGIALLYWAAQSFNEGAVLFGLALPVVGLSALGISLARYDLGVVGALIPLGLGAAALIYGVVRTHQLIEVAIITAVASVIIAAIGAWFVFRGEALIAVLLLGFVIGWVLVDRDTTASDDPFPTADLTFLAVGDSFISGEGAPRFFAGTNIVGPNGNQCRRAPTAYPYLVAERLDAGLIFLACSGAKTTDMDNAGDPPVEFPEVAGNEDQLQRLLAQEGLRVADLDAVFVSIGGNDVGFGTIIKACLLPQSCAVAGRIDRWLGNVEEAGPLLTDTFRTLKSVVGEETPVIAMPYPTIVRPDDRCDLAIDADEVVFVERFTAALNDRVATSAAEAGINFFEQSIDAFDGQLLCDDDPATNFFHLGPTEGPIADTILPTNWVHGTLHPRASGHRLIADRLATEPTDDAPSTGFLVSLLESTAAGEPANPPPSEAAPGGAEPDPQFEELPDSEWIQERLYETAADLVPPVGLLLVGGLLAAFGLIKTRKLEFLNPSNN